MTLLPITVRRLAADAASSLPSGADVDVALFVEPEIGTRERAVVPLAFVPHGNVRRDLGADQLAPDGSVAEDEHGVATADCSS